jgi:predicted nucleotidyltransferase
MDLPPDFNDLLVAFASERVECLIVGGYAVAFHARPRATKDLDILLAGDAANLDRAARALELFGAPATVVTAVRSLKPTEIAYLGQPPLRIDLLREIDGVDTPGVFARAQAASWGGVAVKIIALDDLIANKRAAGRPQDLIDADLLERVKQRG